MVAMSLLEKCPPSLGNQPIHMDVGYPTGYISLILRVLVQNEALFCDTSPPSISYIWTLNGYSSAVK
jgi:hypothetical protein